MDQVIIYNAPTPEGLTLARSLINIGYSVIGLGENFTHCPFNHKDFQRITVGSPNEIKESLADIEPQLNCLTALILLHPPISEESVRNYHDELWAQDFLAERFLNTLASNFGALITVRYPQVGSILHGAYAEALSHLHNRWVEQAQGINTLEIEVQHNPGGTLDPERLGTLITQLFQAQLFPYVRQITLEGSEQATPAAAREPVKDLFLPLKEHYPKPEPKIKTPEPKLPEGVIRKLKKTPKQEKKAEKPPEPAKKQAKKAVKKVVKKKTVTKKATTSKKTVAKKAKKQVSKPKTKAKTVAQEAPPAQAPAAAPKRNRSRRNQRRASSI